MVGITKRKLAFVYICIITYSKAIHIDMEHNLQEGDHQGEEEPDFNHLDITCRRKTVRDTEEHGCQD